MKAILAFALALAACYSLGQPAAKTNKSDYSALLAQDRQVKPQVAGYAAKPGLTNVANYKLFRKQLNARDRTLLAKNLLVVQPTDYDQMFQVYENNEYQRPVKFPAFITTDSMLHEYHVFYDYSLREVEQGKLYGICLRLTDEMLEASIKDFHATNDPPVRDAAQRNVAFFSVAKSLLTGSRVTGLEPAGAMARVDLAAIKRHEGRSLSRSLNSVVDFSQFVPRGHYTRTKILRQYFLAMMWYGNVGFGLPDRGTGIGSGPTLAALLITHNLDRIPGAFALWQTIYEPTAFYVGKSDDLTAVQYLAVSKRVFGATPGVDSFAEPNRLARFFVEANQLPGPAIDNTSPTHLLPRGRQFRFMGQRFIPDSRILQQLTYPNVADRSMPAGLDVMAALGSERALAHLADFYHVRERSGYAGQLAKMRGEIEATPQSTWTSNLYWGWLWDLRSLVKPVPKGYPSFMESSAWLDKGIQAALGSWTELRHDTILYGKQSVAECGDGEEVIPKTPKGYVEPSLEVWTKLLWLNSATREGLAKRHLLSEKLADTFNQIGDWLDFCRKISIKELTGKKVTADEYEQMTTYGADLESLQNRFANGAIVSETDRNMAVVADVHTDAGGGEVLEEGVGEAAVIYAIMPIEGKLYLTRGATFSHYEFTHPMSDRLTDEAWQEMLKHKGVPGVAPWVKSFMNGAKQVFPDEFAEATSGC